MWGGRCWVRWDAHLGKIFNHHRRTRGGHPLEDWRKLLGDVPSATAILGRYFHHAEILSITGRSYRLKDHFAKETLGKEKERPDKSEKSTDDEKTG